MVLMRTIFLRCILGEMVTKRVILQGQSDPAQLGLIFDLCGSPPLDWERYTSVLSRREVINDYFKSDSRKHIPVREVVTPHFRPSRLMHDSRFQNK